MTCLRCKHHEAKRFGFYGRNKNQRCRCPGCKATFSEPRQRPLGRNYISTEKAAQVVTFLLERMSVRAVSPQHWRPPGHDSFVASHCREQIAQPFRFPCAKHSTAICASR
jgi:hypothetical protein